MRIAVTLVIEMTDAQVEQYADVQGIPCAKSGKPYAKEVVEDVRSYVLARIQDSPAFGEIGYGSETRGASVTIK